MQNFIVYFCLILFAAYHLEAKVVPKQADCDDFQKLCNDRVYTLPYECDKSCTEFIVCYTTNDKPMGELKRCPAEQYYDRSRKICTNQKPVDCS